MKKLEWRWLKISLKFPISSDDGVTPVIGHIMLVLIVVVLAAAISATIFGLVRFESSPIPAISVYRVNSTSISLVIDTYGGVSTVEKVKITSPVTINVDMDKVGDGDDVWDVGEIITLKDPALVSGAHLIVVASVDGDEKIVLDTTI